MHNLPLQGRFSRVGTPSSYAPTTGAFYVVPLTVIILVALFAVQSRGTANVASLFAPITLIWFVAIAAAGLWHISQNITVLQEPSSLMVLRG